jgi:hypothetical protein
LLFVEHLYQPRAARLTWAIPVRLKMLYHIENIRLLAGISGASHGKDHTSFFSPGVAP